MKKGKKKSFAQVGEYSDFLSLAYHQIKNSLTSMRGYIQLLQKQAQDEKTKEYVEKVRKQSDTITRLIHALSIINKLQKDKVKNDLEIIQIDEFLKNYIEKLRLENRRRIISTEINTKEQVIFDREHLEIIISQLISNALKFSSKEIHVTAIKHLDSIKICVEDTGIGIPKGREKEIFLPFSNMYLERREKYPGIGLGIFLSKELVISHKGSLWLENSELGVKVCSTIPILKTK